MLMFILNWSLNFWRNNRRLIWERCWLSSWRRQDMKYFLSLIYVLSSIIDTSFKFLINWRENMSFIYIVDIVDILFLLLIFQFDFFIFTLKFYLIILFWLWKKLYLVFLNLTYIAFIIQLMLRCRELRGCFMDLLNWDVIYFLHNLKTGIWRTRFFFLLNHSI